MQSEGTPEKFFRELELQRTRALVERDMKTLEELHAPEYELITPAGKAFDRKSYLEAIEREPFYAGWEAGEMAFRISPVMAVVGTKQGSHFRPVESCCAGTPMHTKIERGCGKQFGRKPPKSSRLSHNGSNGRAA